MKREDNDDDGKMEVSSFVSFVASKPVKEVHEQDCE